MIEYGSRSNVDNDRLLNNGRLSTSILDANSGNGVKLRTMHSFEKHRDSLEFRIQIGKTELNSVLNIQLYGTIPIDVYLFIAVM